MLIFGLLFVLNLSVLCLFVLVDGLTIILGYEFLKFEGKIGILEKFLLDLGLLFYRSYWL